MTEKNTQKANYKIAIIGGGASGMMSGATLVESGENLDIHLFERNKNLGAKVIISGGGRCNITTGINDINDLSKKYTRGINFFKNSLKAFPPRKVCEWFENHGIRLKTENDNRVFPKSNNGKEIVECFTKIFEKTKLNVHLNESILDIEYSDNKFNITSDKQTYNFDIIILTTGGQAFSHTGSKGDGYFFAKKLGHTITKLGPSLNSFETKENFPKNLSGISFKKAYISFREENKIKNIEGPFLFTHFGISGPLTFSLSSYIAFENISKDSPFDIKMSPEKKQFEEIEKTLIDEIQKNGNKLFTNILHKFYPERFCKELLNLANINTSKKSSEISKEERKKVSKFLSEGINLTLIKRRPGDEFVTAGGVNTEEIENKTMRSKINPNLYFAGEILNIDGLTGGFNLQVAWSTGKIASENILKNLFQK